MSRLSLWDSLPLDVLIVTIGDEPDIDYMSAMGIETTGRGTLKVNPETLTPREASEILYRLKKR